MIFDRAAVLADDAGLCIWLRITFRVLGDVPAYTKKCRSYVPSSMCTVDIRDSGANASK